jgi:hypothetical protein
MDKGTPGFVAGFSSCLRPQHRWLRRRAPIESECAGYYAFNVTGTGLVQRCKPLVATRASVSTNESRAGARLAWPWSRLALLGAGASLRRSKKA